MSGFSMPSNMGSGMPGGFHFVNMSGSQGSNGIGGMESMLASLFGGMSNTGVGGSGFGPGSFFGTASPFKARSSFGTARTQTRTAGLRSGTMVTLCGLNSAGGFNGRQARVLGYSLKKGR